jgi:hypothetical protein
MCFQIWIAGLSHDVLHVSLATTALSTQFQRKSFATVPSAQGFALHMIRHRPAQVPACLNVLFLSMCFACDPWLVVIADRFALFVH